MFFKILLVFFTLAKMTRQQVNNENKWRLSWHIDGKTYCLTSEKDEIKPGVFLTAVESTDCCKTFYYHTHPIYPSSWVEGISRLNLCISVEKKNGSFDGKKLIFDIDCGAYTFRGRRDGKMELLQDDFYCITFEENFNVLRPCDKVDLVVDGAKCYNQIQYTIDSFLSKDTPPPISTNSFMNNASSNDFLHSVKNAETKFKGYTEDLINKETTQQKIFRSTKLVMDRTTSAERTEILIQPSFSQTSTVPGKTSFSIQPIQSPKTITATSTLTQENMVHSSILYNTTTQDNQINLSGSTKVDKKKNSVQSEEKSSSILLLEPESENQMLFSKTIQDVDSNNVGTSSKTEVSQTSITQVTPTANPISTNIQPSDQSIILSKESLHENQASSKDEEHITSRFKNITRIRGNTKFLQTSYLTPLLQTSLIQTSLLKTSLIQKLPLQTSLFQTSLLQKSTLHTRLLQTSQTLSKNAYKGLTLHIASSKTFQETAASLFDNSKTKALIQHSMDFQASTQNDEGIMISSFVSSTSSETSQSSVINNKKEIYSNWAPWSSCIGKCNVGYRQRNRQCLYDMSICDEEGESEKEVCNLEPCSVDGGLTEWTDWSNCSEPCGGGVVSRERYCENPKPTFNGKDCLGLRREEQVCNVHFCPVDGGWSAWSNFSHCNKPCNNGTIVRSRECNNPKPKFNGKTCVGDSEEFQPCNRHKCEEAYTDLYITFDDTVEERAKQTNSTVEGFIEKNVMLLFNDGLSQDSLQDVNVSSLDYSNGTLKGARLRLKFSALDFDQLVLLIEAIGEFNQIGKLSVKGKYHIAAENTPKVIPVNVTGLSTPLNSMDITWDELNPEPNITYVLFYKRSIASMLSYKAIGAKCCKVTLSGLKSGEVYDIVVVPYNSFGNGMPSNKVQVSTANQAPQAFPIKLYIVDDKFESYIYWELNENAKRSTIEGYSVTFLLTTTLEIIEPVHICKEDTLKLPELKPSTDYFVDIYAFNRYAAGEKRRFAIRTSDKGPTQSVENMTLATVNISGIEALKLRWQPIPSNESNGVITQYCFQWNEIPIFPTYTKTTSLEECVSPNSSSLLITNTKPFHKVNVTAWGVNQYDKGEEMKLTFPGLRSCPQVLHTNYLLQHPYTCTEEKQGIGCLFGLLIKNATEWICGNNTYLETQFNGLGGWSLKRFSYQMKNDIEKGVDISFPVNGFNAFMEYESSVFVPVMPYPEIIVFAEKKDSSFFIMKAGNMMLGCWPVLVVNVVFITCAGIFIWLFEMQYNEDFPSQFLPGVSHGMWWAFVSSTTLGYGDKTPRSSQGRVFSIIWMLVGIVTIAILNGFLTSSFNATYVNSVYSLYGKTAAVLPESREYRFAIRRNARVNSDRNYTTVYEMIDSLLAREVDYILLDSYSAAAAPYLLQHEKIKIAGIVQDTSAYGYMMSRQFDGFSSELKDYILVHQNKIFSYMKEYTVTFEVHKETGSLISLFNSSSPFFQYGFKVLGFMLLSFFILGYFYDLTLKKREQSRIKPVSVVVIERHVALQNLFNETKKLIEEDLRRKIYQLTEKEIKLILSHRHGFVPWNITPNYFQKEIIDIPLTLFEAPRKLSEIKTKKQLDAVPIWFLADKKKYQYL